MSVHPTVHPTGVRPGEVTTCVGPHGDVAAVKSESARPVIAKVGTNATPVRSPWQSSAKQLHIQRIQQKVESAKGGTKAKSEKVSESAGPAKGDEPAD